MSGGPRLCPVTILAGFLGAGKTTLLRGALDDLARRAAEAGRTGPGGVAVVINEFGSTGLDHEFVLEAAEKPVVVAGGCACCTRREELAVALRTILDASEGGHRRPLDHIVIETSGLADPAPIAFTIASDAVLQHHFRVDSIITAVDALAGASQLDRFAEAAKQVEVADRIVVTKLDLASPDTTEALFARLRELNPVVEPEPAGGRSLLPIPGPASRRVPMAFEQCEGRQGAAAEHTAQVRSLSLNLDQPVDWVAFGVWLTMLLHRHGERVLRLKGIVAASGFGPVFINSVQHVISPPEHAGPGPQAGSTRLVFILRDLSPAAVARSFRIFQAAA